MKKHKILIIEDDADLREGLSFSFPVTDMRWQRQKQKRMVCVR